MNEDVVLLGDVELQAAYDELKASRRASGRRIRALRKELRSRKVCEASAASGVAIGDLIEWLCVNKGNNWSRGIVVGIDIIRKEIVYTARLHTADGREAGKLVGIPPNALVRKVGATD